MPEKHGEREQGEPLPTPDVEIDLELEAIRDRGMRLLSEVGYPTEPFGVYLFHASSPDAELARYVEQVVFEETFGNSREMLDDEYAPYHDATIFVCVMDQRRHVPVGAMRLITPSPAGFKTLHDLERIWGIHPDDVDREHRIGLDTSSMMDVTTLSVMSEYRGSATNGLITLSILSGMCGLFRRWSTTWAVCVMDLVVYDLIQKLTGEPYSPFPGAVPKRYLDSPASLPLHCNLAEHWKKLEATDRFMTEISHGRGLGEAVRPPDYSEEVLPASSLAARKGATDLASRTG